MRRFMLLALLVTAVFTTLVSAAPQQRPLYDDRFFVPVADVVTPHIAWAKPYAAPPKVLFITYREGMREVIELAERLDMDYKVFACQSSGKFGETGIGVDSSWKLIRGNSAEEMTANLMDLLKTKYDVIVCGNIQWDALPLECRYEILKQVKAGTGLVGALHGQDQYLKQLLKTTDFAWNWATWSGASQGVADFFGIGDFSGRVDYSGGHTGQAALRIECKSVTKGSREAARAGYHSPEVPLEPGAEYVFSAWTRTDGLKEGGASVSLHPQAGMSVPPSADWTYHETKFKAKGDKPALRAYLLVYQPGTVWYDDVKLVKAGTEANLLPNASFEYPGPAPAELAQGVPYAAMPAFRKAKDEESFLRGNFQTATFGQGRLGLVSYGLGSQQMMTPAPSGPVQYCRDEYDYDLLAAIKLILWGAQKSPEVGFSAPALTGALGKTALTVNCSSARIIPGATVVFSFANDRDGHGTAIKQMVNLKQGDNALQVTAPALPNGPSFLNCWAMMGGKIIGFGSLPLQVTNPLKLAQVTLDSDTVALKQPLAGKVEIEGTPAAGTQLQLSVRDTVGRLVTRQTVPVTGATTAFRVPLPPMVTIVGWLNAELVDSKGLQDFKRVDFTVSNRYAPRDDVQFVMWQGYPNNFVAPTMAEQFTRAGVDAFYDGGNLGYGPYANQWWLPYATRFTDSKTDWYQLKPTREQGDLVRSPCLNDPAFRQKTRDGLGKIAARGLKYSTSDFTLGDENMFVAGNWDLCFSQYCNEDFRQWARGTYGTLEALNKEWGTSYTGWDQVLPQTLEQCKKTGNLVPWVDHRLHMESVWAGIHDWSRGVIKETVPHARVGYEGSDTVPTSWQADDYWKLAQAMNLNNIYYRDFLSLAVRDFSTPDTLLGGGWFGGYANNRNEPFMRWFPWRTLFKGSNSFWVWCGYGNEGSVMAYDTSLYPFFQSACDEIREIKQGSGKLLMGAARENDGIALLWSSPSVHVGTCTPGFPDMDSVLTSTVTLLHDCGLEAKVLSYAQLAQGKLTNKDFKVLILPCSQALSGAEVEQIKQFVSGGGTVIADLRPAVTDEHGKPYATPALDELLGVTQGAQYKGVEGELKYEVKAAGAEAPAFGTLTADGSLKPAAGHALGAVGTAPALIANDFGKGHTLLLNFTLRGYLSLPKQAGAEFAGWDEGAPYRGVLTGLLEVAGVRPAVRVTPDAPHVEISRFRQGGAEYVGIVQSLPLPPLDYTNKVAPAPTPRPVTIEFGHKAQVYDVRAGKYLGELASYKTQMTPGVAQLYALLPYKVSQVNVVASAPQGGVVTYTAKLVGSAAPVAHVLRVRVIGPDGTERTWYARNLATAQGKAQGTINLALSDEPGTWKVLARDVATGVTGTATFKVTP